MRKILFNDRVGQTNAVVKGDKTRMRRPIKTPARCEVQVIDMTNGDKVSVFVNPFSSSCAVFDGKVPVKGFEKVCNPQYRIGEVLAVARSYRDLYGFYNFTLKDGTEAKNSKGWSNRLCVDAEEMLDFIKITDIHVEHMQDISTDDDYVREGIYEFGDTYHYYTYDERLHMTPRDAFASMMDDLFGDGTWESNPYVFVYDFKRCNERGELK